MGSVHKYACLRGPMVHVPVIVISPSDRRLEEATAGRKGFGGGPVIHSKLDIGRMQGQKVKRRRGVRRGLEESRLA